LALAPDPRGAARASALTALTAAAWMVSTRTSGGPKRDGEKELAGAGETGGAAVGTPGKTPSARGPPGSEPGPGPTG
jgi:hypothetical protein